MSLISDFGMLSPSMVATWFGRAGWDSGFEAGAQGSVGILGAELQRKGASIWGPALMSSEPESPPHEV